MLGKFKSIIFCSLLLAIRGTIAKNKACCTKYKDEYNGFEFTQHTSGRWLTYMGDKPIALINYPGNVENITFPIFLSLNDLNSADKVYLTYDHNKSIDLVLTE